MDRREDTIQGLGRLSAAQRRYLLELEPNRVNEGLANWVAEVETQFQNRSHRKPLRGPGLATAHSLIRKGIVKPRPEPCECGYHYVSLTPLGIEMRAALQAPPNTSIGERDDD
jgi:hypothetical protein